MNTEMDLKALWRLSYGLYIVSSVAEGRRGGQVANAVMQLSSSPPLVGVCLNKENYTHSLVSTSGLMGLSVLSESAPMELIGLFGFRSSRDVDKLAQVKWMEGPQGLALVTEHALATMALKVVKTLDVGTHTLFVGELLLAKVLAQGQPLTYAQYQARKGRAPKAAPTYHAPETTKEGDKEMKKYVCNVCGYVYDPAKGDSEGGIAPGTAFEDLPEDWVCPVCGASKDEFEPED